MGTLELGIALLMIVVAWSFGWVLPAPPAPLFVVLGGVAGFLVGRGLGGTPEPPPPTPTAPSASKHATEPPLPSIQAVSHPLETVEGIGRGYGTRIRDLGIPDTAALLEFGAVAARRIDLATQLKVEPLVVQRWTSMADLLRIPDLDAQSAEVLEASGVRTVVGLSECSPVVLVGRLLEVNARLRLTPGDLPNVEQMERWIGLAGVLPQVIEDL